MGGHLVLVGGGHAHLATLKTVGNYLSRGHRVSLISPSAYQYYSGMGPGLLSGIYRPQDVRFNVGKMVESGGGAFIESHVTRIEPGSRALILADGRTVTYDVASFNLGSEVVLDGLVATPESVFPVKPIINLLVARRSILERSREDEISIVVVGGGAAGIELAGNAWRLSRVNGMRARISLVSKGTVLERFPARARRLALESFSSRGITVREQVGMISIDTSHLGLSDGTNLPYDFAFLASGIRPPGVFRESGLPVTEDGSLLVNRELRCVGHPELFGGGDCISVEGYRLAKVGVHAVGQSHVLRHNLLAALDGGPMRPFVPKEHFMLILNMGDGSGILCKRNRIFGGRWGFLLKDYVDRRFMRRFQVSGERIES